MNIFDIAVSLCINEEKALAIMQKMLPSLPFLPMTEALKCQDEKSLWVSVTNYDNPVFPSQITIWRLPQFEERYYSDILYALCRQLSLTLSCRTLCDGSGHGDDQTPYWGLIFAASNP